MAQTKAGAKKVKEIYGKDFHHQIGLKGGNPMLNRVRDEKLKLKEDKTKEAA